MIAIFRLQQRVKDFSRVEVFWIYMRPERFRSSAGNCKSSIGPYTSFASFLLRWLSLNQSVMLLKHLKCAFVTSEWLLPVLYEDLVLTDTHKEFIFKKSRKSNYFLLT